MLRLFLPPNLAAAAPRDAIALRVELEAGADPSSDLLPALALLQRWCATPVPPRFIQLTRQQLRELVAALRGQPAFFWVNLPAKSIEWTGDALPGVSEHLVVTATAANTEAPVQAAPVSRKPKTLNPEAAAPMLVDGTEPIKERLFLL